MAVDVGDVYRCTWSSVSAAGAPVNADTVALTITLPDGTSTVVAPVNPPATTGKYIYDFPTTLPGRHVAHWVGTGAGANAYTEVFDVRAADPPYILSLADAKAHLNKTHDEDDEELRGFIEAVTQVVEDHTKLAVVRAPRVDYFDLRSATRSVTLSWTPVVSLTSVAALSGSGLWTAADLWVDPTSGVLRATAGALYGAFSVTYVAGMQVIPAKYIQAAKIILQHLWDTQRGTAGSPGVGGLETPGAGFTSFGYAIPNRAIELLGPSGPLVA